MPSLETRRIYRAGNALVVSLPKGWLNFLHLQRGDELEILVDTDLTIRPAPKVDNPHDPAEIPA